MGIGGNAMGVGAMGIGGRTAKIGGNAGNNMVSSKNIANNR